ncbi:MAG: hypothetical protein GX435_06615 [Exilispira sp.]|nr:hypothetical protein [Exilispira sp.]
MKLNFKIALIVIFLISILLMSFNFQISYSQILDIENIQKLKYIETVYDIFGNGKSSIETIKYFIDDSIYIEETCAGEFGNGYYTITTDSSFRPLVTETKYSSEVEKIDFFERYIYNYNNLTITYYDLKKQSSKIFDLKNISGDSITLGEVMVFMNIAKLKDYSTYGLVVPGAMKVPFIFKYIRQDYFQVDNENMIEEIYHADIDQPFIQFISSLFGNKAEIHVNHAFPHIRIRSFYSIRTIVLKNYKILYK